MYFWNVRELKHHLVQEPTPTESLRYVLALVLAPLALELVLLPSVLVMPAELPDVEMTTDVAQQAKFSTLAYAASRLALGILLLLGLVYCYRRNGGPGGVSFLPRLAALAWVCAVRVYLLVILPLSIVLSFVVMVAYSQSWAEGFWMWFLLTPLAALLILWRTGRHIADVAGTSLGSVKGGSGHR